MKPKEVWSSMDKAGIWLKRSEYIASHIDPEIDTDVQSVHAFIRDVSMYDFNSVLEVGAGNGRLIGTLSNTLDCKCTSVDINLTLSKYVHLKYPRVHTYVADAAKLPFKDDSFDLVFTYQVLQHVPPEEMTQILKELQRVSRNEIWLMEGYDPEIKAAGYPNGHMRTDADGGSFSWFFEDLLDCYEVSIPKSDKLPNMGVRLYKIKKKIDETDS